MNSIGVLEEPQLEFASGGMAAHPCDGLTLFGPADSATTPLKLSYGVIGTRNGVKAFRDFVEAASRPILTGHYLDETIWPHFPGFEEAFHAALSPEPSWAEEMDTLRLKHAASERNDHKRVFTVVSLFLDRMRTAKKPDNPFQAFVVVVPDFIFTNCRPLSSFEGGHGRRISQREQRVRALTPDFFDTMEPELYSSSLDFRFQMKSRAMDLGLPVQIIRESTLRLAAAERQFWGRQLSPLSDRAWNLCTALYYKSGGKPWKLNGMREGICHVGVSFRYMDMSDATRCFAQTFLDDGDGSVTVGDEGPWRSEKKTDYHLNKESARRLLAGVLNSYPSAHNKKLTEVFLYTRSKLNENELNGYRAACSEGVKLVAVRVAPERMGLRLYRTGAQPVLRGTLWQISSKRAFLWCSGFKPRLRTYDGLEIPQPLCIDVQYGDADAERVAKNVFALTKLNYNCCRLGENQPVTTHFSGLVGEILAGNQKLMNHKPNLKYYI